MSKSPDIIMTVEDRFTLYARGGLRHTRLMDRDTATKQGTEEADDMTGDIRCLFE